MSNHDIPRTPDSEMKPLTIRVPPTVRERFTSLAQNEGLNQTDMFVRILSNYPPDDSKNDLERAELFQVKATVQEVATNLESLVTKINDSHETEWYKRSLLELAEEALAMNTLLGGVQRLHETLENSHKLILEASEKAVEPFQKIVLDQAQQAEKFAQNYNAIATNVQSLEKASASALHNAEKMANALDHQVTSAVIESTHRLYRKTEEYISNRNTFLNFIAIGTVVALFAALWSIWSAKRANEGYVDYFYGFRSSVCEYRRGQKEMLEAYLKSVECR